MDGSAPAGEPGLGEVVHVESVPDDEDRGSELAAKLTKEGREGVGHDAMVLEEKEAKSHPPPTGGDREGAVQPPAVFCPKPLVSYPAPDGHSRQRAMALYRRRSRDFGLPCGPISHVLPEV